MENQFRDGYLGVHFRCPAPGVPACFNIVTAYNPDGLVAGQTANREATAQFEAELARLGYPSFPVTGGSADFSHAEPGFGIECPRSVALELAQRFRQEAIFEVRAGEVFLVSASPDGPPEERIGRWAELLAD